MPEVILHRLVRKDMDGVRKYYTEKSGVELANRFYMDFMAAVGKVVEMPTRYHPVHGTLRRTAIYGFPSHFLFREIPTGIRVLVLRHDKRHPSYGLSRQ